MQNDEHSTSVKFHLPDDEDVDEEESSYLNHATQRLLHPQMYNSTDDESNYSLDRLNSSDFFDAPEAVFSVPQPRIKRLSQEKQKGHHKSKSDEKDLKKRLSASRDLKQQVIREHVEDEQNIKKKPSRSEAKLRHKSRSMERDDKKGPPQAAVQPIAVKRLQAVEYDQSVPRDDDVTTDSTRRRHGSGDSVGRDRDSDTEKKMFYKQIVLTMQLGRKAYRDREERGRTLSDKLSPLQRQYSEIIYNRDTMSHEMLYIALQAHRTQMVMEDCAQLFWKHREKVPEKIDEVNRFAFVQESDYSDFNVSDLLSNPFEITDEYLYNIEIAIDQVADIVESIDMVLSLYPNTKCMRRDFSDCASSGYQKRVCALNMWLNNAKALISVIKGVGARVGVEKMSCIQWPFVDPVETVNSSVQSAATLSTQNGSTPQSPASDVSKEEYPTSATEINRKRVTFDSGTPLSSSPNTNSVPLIQLESPQTQDYTNNSRHMIMSNSFSLIDIQASPTSFYRPTVDRLLRKTSMLDMLRSNAPPVVKPLLKAKYAIVKLEMEPVPVDNKIEPPQLKAYEVLALSPDHDIITLDMKIQEREATDDHFVTFYQEAIDMKLPSLIPLYVFLARFPLDLTHESLRLRLEQHIENPSLPIIRQVVHECSEAAKAAISVKQSYLFFLAPITKKLCITDETLERYIERFNMDLKEILEVYFGYVQYGMKTIRKDTTPHSLKTFLEEEWSFSKEICPYITGGMADAGKQFCGMCSILLQSIQNQLEQELDKSLFDNNPTVYSPDGLSSPVRDITCTLNCSPVTDDICTTADYRQMLMKSCREIKTLFTEMREWASKALSFAKLLRKDLEIAAEFKVTVKSKALMHVLQSSHHVKVETPHTADYIIVVPASIKDDKQSLTSLLDVTCGREETLSENTTPNREGYMLLINCGDDCKWTGPVLKVEPKTETTIALSHIGVDGLFLIVTHSSQLSRQRKDFCTVAGSSVELVNEQTTCHQAIAEAWCELRTYAFELASGVQKAIEHVENQLDSTDLESLDTDSDRKTIKAAYKETLHQCYSFGFEFLQEFSKLNTSSGQAALQKDQVLLSFAHQWIEFVLNKCEQGKGTRPRWANPGFDFLSLVVEPSITKNISDEEFEYLKSKVHEVINHIIGVVSTGSQSPQSHRRTGVSSPVHNPVRFLSVDNGLTKRQFSSGSASSKRSTFSEPATPFDRADSWRPRAESSSSSLVSHPSIPGLTSRSSNERNSTCPVSPPLYINNESPTFSLDMLPPDRSQAAVNLLDRNRDDLLRDKKVIGHMSEGHQNTNLVRINVRKVNFKWQRGTKIGEGQFGVVYTAINCDTNCMMAMKELRFQPNDVQTIKLIADELKTFEGINHPNLVKYYGIEVHKEEILIFMEYCAEGTLEEMSRIGLTESLIRRYTRELVIAIEYLHEHNIIHRDIKGANIFLVANDKLKLGDFGCSAKLKEHTTIPGEMVAFVGTAAFMAPEVITQKGHGRSADIWSLGCVVIEMVTGKRPWHEMDNMHQIMFKVGMGNIPAIPETFHQEGNDFLLCCFEVEPVNRSTANDLIAHTFLKV